MPDGRQQKVNPLPPMAALSEIISPLRLGTYLNSAGHDAERALNLYLWNAKVAESFHMPIQAVEVGFRNRVSAGLQSAFGNDWWHDPPFLALAGERREIDIQQTKRRLTSKGKPLITGQIVAGLSFGFWVAMMDRRYHPAIWSSHLRSAFPHLPDGVDHRRLHSEVGMVADLRNRLWHHEPIFRRDLMADYSRCMLVLSWLCPVKAKWIKPHCRVAQMMREKP